MIASIFFTRQSLVMRFKPLMPNRRRICKAGPRANMKAIILSAGQGSRLGHLVDDRPKCLIDFNGRTLLDRQLDTLEANGVHEAVVVTGFHDELVEEAIARRSGGPGGADDLQSLLQGRRQYRLAVHGARGARAAIAWCGTAIRSCRAR